MNGTTALTRDDLQAGVDAGVLPAQVLQSTASAADRPWPVVLLTALGAWLSAGPLIAMAGLLFGDALVRGAAPYPVGLLVLAGALVVLRSRAVPLFLEQLAVPALLVGGGVLSFGLYRDLSIGAASGVLLVLTVSVAVLVPMGWLRLALGATAAALMTMVVQDSLGALSGGPGHGAWPVWWALQALVLLWVVIVVAWAPRALTGPRARWPVVVEPIATGWAVVALVALALWAGTAFLLAGIGPMDGAGASGMWVSDHLLPWLQAASLLQALGAVGWLRQRWAAFKPLPTTAALLLAATLAWWLPSLGAVLWLLAAALLTARWRLAMAAALAAGWVVGSFYYQLHWPLQAKAGVLVGLGALLAALAWYLGVAAKGGRPVPRLLGGTAGRSWLRGSGVLLTLVASLLLVNADVVRKERLIDRGQPVYVALAPVDPRSLMQGDYMRLAFAMPPALGWMPLRDHPDAVPEVRLQRDARGVARVVGLMQPGQRLSAGELRVRLVAKNGQWVLVTDAWFFPEGQAERFTRARYGEFRVDDQGRALLVGLADEHLQPL